MSDESSPLDIGPYSALREVGRGGSSVVFAAVAPDGTDVAIKVFNVGAGDPATKRRLEREAAALETLRDIPGVLAVLDHRFTPDGRPCLVMPLMAGGSLADELTRGPLRADRALGVGEQVARALASAHRRDVVHRDIKPANLLVDGDGGVVIADFGIAAIGDLELASQTIASLSPPYAPPERFVDSVETASAPADVYSLAATIYALLAGAPPFGTSAQGGIAGLMTRVTSNQVSPIARDDLPEGTMAVLTAAMAKDPGARYPTMDDFADQLRCLRTGGVPGLPVEPTDATIRRSSLAGRSAVAGAMDPESELVAEPLVDGPGNEALDGAEEGSVGSGRRSRRTKVVAGVAALLAVAVIPVVAWSTGGSDDTASGQTVQVRSETTIRERTTSSTMSTATSGEPSTVPPTSVAAPLDGGVPAATLDGGPDRQSTPVVPAPGAPPVAGVELGPAQSVQAPAIAPAPAPSPSSSPSPAPAPTPTPVPRVGDINGDGRTGCADMRILLDEYGSSSARSDLDRDGKVGLRDLSMLLSNYNGDGTTFDDGTNRCPND